LSVDGFSGDAVSSASILNDAGDGVVLELYLHPAGQAEAAATT